MKCSIQINLHATAQTGLRVARANKNPQCNLENACNRPCTFNDVSHFTHAVLPPFSHYCYQSLRSLHKLNCDCTHLHISRFRITHFTHASPFLLSLRQPNTCSCRGDDVNCFCCNAHAHAVTCAHALCKCPEEVVSSQST